MLIAARSSFSPSRAERNGPVFGDGIVVGVDLDGVAPMNAVGDGHRKRGRNDRRAWRSRKWSQKEQMMIIELLELR